LSNTSAQQQRSSSGTRTPTIGKPKRNPPSTGNVNEEWTHDLFSGTAASPLGAQSSHGGKAARASKEVRLYSAINGTTSPQTNQFNIVGGSKPTNGISIRGLAGPSIVVAENFAPGTTAADIESAMAPFGGPILKCRLLPSTSTVIAEIVFDTRDGADSVIEQFNNQTVSAVEINTWFHLTEPIIG
jgi:hypothetical protein